MLSYIYTLLVLCCRTCNIIFCHFKLLSLLAHLQYLFSSLQRWSPKSNKADTINKMIQTMLNIVTQPLYQQWSSTSRTTVVFFVLYYSEVLSKHHIDKRENGYSSIMCFLDEIQTMFPQLANQPSRVLPADMFTDHLLKKQRLMVLRKIKKGKLKAGQFLFIILYFGYSQGC